VHEQFLTGATVDAPVDLLDAAVSLTAL